jgi:iron complex outermembrane receptor protein
MMLKIIPKNLLLPRISWKHLIAVLLTPLLWISPPVNASTQILDQLTELGLEELMEIDITSFGMKPQAVFRTAAAVFVITPEDIRRSGATSIPELLRMVPGFEVARINAHKWAITSRGFNGSFATKLLVLIDGRSVYSPLSSGVFWDEQDTFLEDVERIEVVRGPGGSLWGANAVNGVINIITKNSRKTQGTLVSMGAGTEERGFLGLRYGGALSEQAHYRFYVKASERDGGFDNQIRGTHDDWSKKQAGFRLDWENGLKDRLTLQGDLYSGKAGEVLSSPLLSPPYKLTETTDIKISGGNFLTRWQRQTPQGSTLNFQAYYDRNERDNGRLSAKYDTVDLNFFHNWKWGRFQEITWGLNYRLTHDELSDNFFFSFDPSSATHHLYGGFLQDEFGFFDRQVLLTIGSKVEVNQESGLENQPSARLLWNPHPNHSFWASAGRAVRVPDRIESDATHHPQAIPGNPPRVLTIRGNQDLASEDVIAYELGYRFYQKEDFRIDLAAFTNIYEKLRTFETQKPVSVSSSQPADLSSPIQIDNTMKGKTYGVELTLDWKIRNWWRLKGAYTFLKMFLELDGSSNDRFSKGAEGEVPSHQVSLRSSMDLPGGLELDLWGRYVDALPNLDVKSYYSLDMRLAWKLNKKIELAIVGQNLLNSSIRQWNVDRDNHFITEVERSVFGKVTFQF